MEAKDGKESEPVTKKIKLDSDSELKSLKTSLTTKQSSAKVDNGNSVLPPVQNVEELELDDSSGSEEEDSYEDADDEGVNTKSVESNQDSLSPLCEDSVDEPGPSTSSSAGGAKSAPTRKRKLDKNDKSAKSGIGHVKTAKKSNKRKAANLRKNIKDILKTADLGEETLAAQREEAERRQRTNLKLQAQQQQLKLLHQQQSQYMREHGLDSSYNGYSNLSLDAIVKKISQNRNLTLSVEAEETKGKQPRPQDASANEEIVLLSSDEEGEANNYANIQGDEGFNSESAYQWPRIQTVNHFGGTVLAPQDENNVISISSGDEEKDELCDREVESLGRQRGGMMGQQNMSDPIPVESDDDCVVISPTPDDSDDKDERNQDELNVSDEFGRVLVNVGHPDEDPDIFLAPQVAKLVKPHQIGGIRFLYDNVVESVERFNTTSGFGCILAHSMGLGKTIQAVSFCDVFLRAGTAKTVLVIVPINTIQNWLNEFNTWLPPAGAKNSRKTLDKKEKRAKPKPSVKPDVNNSHQSSSQSLISDSVSETVSLNLSFDSTLNLNCVVNDIESIDNVRKPEGTPNKVDDTSDTEVDPVEIHTRSFEVFVLNETVKTLSAREKIIKDWSSKGGVLLIGYEMYRMLALRKLKRSARSKQQPFFTDDSQEQADTLNQIYSCIVDPGPDLVICDEGHRIKNSGASISQALKAIRTKRRVVLTGYPLQNNLMEYWCMVDFIRPNYLGSKVDFSNMFERPISNGQCVDSTPEDRRLMRFRSHVLHSLLEGFVQRRSHAVLHNALPQKQEWVFLLKMTSIQYRLYKEFIKYLSENVEGQSAANPIKAFAVCCKIWNHPDALYNVVKKKQGVLDDLDLDEVNTTEAPKGKRGPKGKKDQNPSAPISYFDGSGFNFPRSHYGSYGGGTSKAGGEALSLDWAVPILQDYVPGILENGVKFEILFEIIKETVSMGDKLLVFSQTLLSLDLTEIFLAQKFQWAKNVQYYRLDGGTTGLEREKLINNFNMKPEVFVFLVSTRAGSLGINLTGANRVVVLDASWNPCHDCQAVCRIYRYGQTKPCQIYRFVSDCTLEKRIYDRQINKRGMSDRVVDEMNPNAQFKTKDVSSFLVLKHEHLDKLPFIKWDLKPEKYNNDPVLQNVLVRVGHKLTQEPFEHESLLIDQKSQRLSATEKRLAHRNYQNEKRSAELSSTSGFSHSRPSYSAYYPKDPSQGSSRSYGQYSSYRNYQMSQEDKFEQHVPALRQKGICVQSIVLKKDSFLADPSGGPDMFLMAGEKVYVLRSVKGTYLRLSNGKLIAVRNSPSNNRIPAMMVPASQELSKEELHGLVYSLLKLPHQYQFGNDSYSDPSSYPPTEQPLPPSPSFFSQSKHHLQVTNARNNSGGDVTMWDGASRNSESENSNGDNSGHGQGSRSRGASRYQTIAKALADSSASPFNPNLERLSFLANQFPGYTQSAESPFQDREQFTHGMSSPFDPSGYPRVASSSSASSPGRGSSTNGSRGSGRAEMELIPISKSNSNPARSYSRSRNDNHNHTQLSRSHKSSESSPHPSFASAFFNNLAFPGGRNPPAQQLLDVNPSFYKDFTITVKGSGASNGSSSESETFNSSPAQPSRKTVQQTYPNQNEGWLSKFAAHDANDSGGEMMGLTESPQSQSTRSACFSATSSNPKTGEYFSQFSSNSKSNHEETDFGGHDFGTPSQYYSDSILSGGSGNGHIISLEDVNETTRHENLPIFPNQGT